MGHKVRIDVKCISYCEASGAVGVASLGEFLSGLVRTPAAYKGGIRVIELQPHFVSSAAALPSFEAEYEAFHRSLPSLPRVDVQGRVAVVKYTSRLLSAEQVMDDDPLDGGTLTAALDESLRALQVAFADDELCSLSLNFERARAELPPDGRSLQLQSDRVRSGLLLNLPLRPGLYSRVHPDAVALTAGNFVWSALPDAPHGTDIGADVLETYAERRRQPARLDGTAFVAALWREWEMPTGSLEWLGRPWTTWSDKDSLAIEAYGDTVLAAAFAELRFRGSCEEELLQEALATVRRSLHPPSIKKLGWACDSSTTCRLREIESAILAALRGRVGLARR